MLINLLRRRLTLLTEQYNNALEHHRAQRLMLFNLALMAYAAFLALPWVLIPILEGQLLPFINILYVIGLLVAAYTVQRQIITGALNQASTLVVAMLIFLVVQPRLGNLHGTDMALLLLPLIAAAVFSNRLTLLVTAGVMGILGLYMAIVQSFSQESIVVEFARSMPGDFSILLVAAILTLLLLLMQGNIAARLARTDLGRDRRIRLVHELRNELDQAQSENAMMVSVADMLRTKLDYTFAQFHLNDAEGRLNTYIQIGMGTRFGVRRTDLPAESMVRAANRQQQYMVATQDSIYEERSHLLPSVTYGIALPLIARGDSLGVLDLQSSEAESPFSEREITILQLIASDLAWSMVRLRNAESSEAAVAERDEVNRTLEQQVTRLRHQLDHSLGSDWLTYLEGRGHEAIGFDLAGKDKTLLTAVDIPAHLHPAMARGEMVIEAAENEQIVSIPIKQRDEVLGAISFALPPQVKLSERQIEMAYQVVNRLATALDNARLVEQTQAQARRERKTSEVANMLLGQQEVHTLLDTAAESFNEALGAIYTHIHIDPDALLSPIQPEEAR